MSTYLHICNNFFYKSLKSHTRGTLGCWQLFPFKKATNIPKGFQGNCWRRNRNKAALNSFLAGKLLTHEFGGPIILISVNKKIYCGSTDFSEEDPHIGQTQEEADTKIIAFSIVTEMLWLKGCASSRNRFQKFTIQWCTIHA